MDYYDFLEVVTNGRKKVNAAENSVMPAFGQNVNVMCYLDDIYTYLKARGADALPRGRPGKKEPKSDAIGMLKTTASAASLSVAAGVLLLAVAGTSPAAAQTSDLVSKKAFRVCADPAPICRCRIARVRGLRTRSPS